MNNLNFNFAQCLNKQHPYIEKLRQSSEMFRNCE